MDEYDILVQCDGFEWDKNNAGKIWLKHGVAPEECEQVFFNRPFVTGRVDKHSRIEARFYALGRTQSGRPLFLVFTIRNEKVRIISARDMSCKERGFYEIQERE